MKKIDLAYMAGLFDGEGNISLHKCKKSYWITACIEMTNDFLPEWFRFAFGGSIFKIPPKKETHAVKYKWQITARQAGEFLMSIYPYLILKKPQAELALKFLREKPPRRIEPGNRRFLSLTDEEKAVMEAQKILMNSLNRKGPNRGH